MPAARLDRILGVALSVRRHDPRPDAELLARFLDYRDEGAFETLVARHAPAVHAACRGWLRSQADVDDAAQATFLVLVRRAGSIRKQQALGAWLYAVAGRVARRLREQQRRWLPLSTDLPAPAPRGDRDLHDLLATEIAQLPEKYRLPTQLCYVAGLTTIEAAQRLGWPKGTVLTRLAWARKRLQQNLSRRGIGRMAILGAVAAAVPEVHASWVRATARTALGLLTGQGRDCVSSSGPVLALTEGVLRTMLWQRVRNVALALLVGLGVLGFGVHRWLLADDQPAQARPASHFGAEADANQRDVSKSSPVALRREAVIRLPRGTFVKEVKVEPYGHGRVTWTYEDERVLGHIEASVMGVEVDLTTEAEYSLSSTGTIYGILTGVQLTHLKLPEGGEWAKLKPIAGLWKAAEPLVSDFVADMPFSYRFRVHDDRLVISNFRMLLAGANPLGKLGLVGDSQPPIGEILLYFQALGTALEGTYTADDSQRVRPRARPRSRTDGQASDFNPAGEIEREARATVRRANSR